MDLSAGILCIALAVYHEARGEPEPGQWMVAAVVQNRVDSKRYPSTPCGVVFDERQFAWVDERATWPRDVIAWQRAVTIAEITVESWGAIHDWGGATHFARGEPGWAAEMTPVASVGGHRSWRE